ncbi:MAG: MFS transporter [Thermoleophilia bacterium]
MKRTDHREPWSRLVLLLGLAGLVVMADNWVVSPILPAIAEGLGTPVTGAGILIAAYMLPFGLFQLFFGPLADRIGKLETILLTLAAFAVVTATGGFMGSLTGLTTVRALTGVFAAATMPVSLALIGDTVPMSRRQKAIGTFMGIAFLGQGISMALGGVIAFSFSWRGVFIIYGVLAAVVTVVLFAGTRTHKGYRSPRGSLLEPYRRLLGHWDSLRVYLIAVAEGILILGLFSYLGALLSSRHGLGSLGVGLVMTFFGAAAVLAGRLSGRTADWIGRKNLIGLALLLGGLSALALAEVHELAVAAVAIFGLGAAFMFAHSSILTIATEFAAHHRGVAMSLVAFAFMGGGSLGTTLAGRVIAADGFGTYLGVWGAGLVVLAGLARVLLAGGVRADRSSAAREGDRPEQAPTPAQVTSERVVL